MSPIPFPFDYDSNYQKIFPILKLDVLCLQFPKAHLLASHDYSKVWPLDNRIDNIRQIVVSYTRVVTCCMCIKNNINIFDHTIYYLIKIL